VIDNARTDLPDASAKIYIFKVEKKPLVESAEAFPKSARYAQARPEHPIHLHGFSV
jgi:hypothetical protein